MMNHFQTLLSDSTCASTVRWFESKAKGERHAVFELEFRQVGPHRINTVFWYSPRRPPRSVPVFMVLAASSTS
jgi:hypothetical protein